MTSAMDRTQSNVYSAARSTIDRYMDLPDDQVFEHEHGGTPVYTSAASALLTDARDYHALLNDLRAADGGYPDAEIPNEHLLARATRDEKVLVITSVRTSFGHRFYAAGGAAGDSIADGAYESCITCGAEFICRPIACAADIARAIIDGWEPVSGEYVTHDGSDPVECTGRTDLYHGYEAVCQADSGRGCPESEDGPCGHLAVDQGCNCVRCA